MGRALRTDIVGYIYHVLNRANARSRIFEADEDYFHFEEIFELAKERFDMRILAYCIMPNHWHLVLYPKKDGEIAKFMNWLTLTHTQRWHAKNATTGQGHLYQGRYKSFLCQSDNHFLSLFRYVERNALRANLVQRAEDWRWSSVWRREKGSVEQKKLLDSWTVRKLDDYLQWLNEPQSEVELESLRKSVQHGSPFGGSIWRDRTVKKFGLEITMRTRGRPQKGS